MVTVYDVPANDLIEVAKEELKQNQNIQPPEWSKYAKSGAHKEAPPVQDDFWYIRAAALLRKEYTKGPLGVSRLRTAYGGARNRGAKPEEHRKGSGSYIRKLLQQLETAGFLKKSKNGRVLTSAGQKFMDAAAYKVSQSTKSAPKQEKQEKQETSKQAPAQKPEAVSEQSQEQPKQPQEPQTEQPQEQ